MNGSQYASLNAQTMIAEPGEKYLAIMRLYLELYPSLELEDREIYREILRSFLAPKFDIQANQRV